MHVLTGEELEILELLEEVLHDVVDVGLELVHLRGPVVVLQVLDHLLHVVLEIDGEVLLGAEPGLDQPVVEDYVDAGDGLLGGALVGLFGGGVGASQNNLVSLAGLVLQI